MKKICLVAAGVFLAGALCIGGIKEYALAAGEDTVSVQTYDSGEESSTGRLAAPVLTEAKAVENGATTISWKAVTGAKGYMVYRKAAGGDWSRLGTTTSTSYKDTDTLKNGKTYYYRVRAYKGSEAEALANKYSSSYWSKRSARALKVVYTETPALSGAVNTASGIKVKWNAVSGASGYAVFRKTSGGSWKMIGTTASVSYTDKTVSPGNKYYYTVRAFRGDEAEALACGRSAEYWSGYDSSGIKGIFLSVPTLKAKVTASAAGPKVSWKTVSGATGYAVYRKASGGRWKLIGTTTSTSYKDDGSLKSGKKYYYTVRAYRGKEATALKHKYSAAYWSYRDGTGVGIVYLKTPALEGAADAGDGVEVSWKSVSGATGYAVYRKTSGGSWTMLGTTKSTSYTDKGASSKKDYYYTVRAYRGSKSAAMDNEGNAAYWSGYDSAGCTAQKGIVKEGSSYYYINDDGSKATGWTKAGSDYYYFDRTTGAMKKGGTMDGIKLSSSGKARASSDDITKIKTMMKAREVYLSITRTSDTKSQKLKKCFDWVLKHPYKRHRILPQARSEHPNTWMCIFANDEFDEGNGCCVSEACAFTFLANECGYTAYVCDDTSHAWTEINGKVYDTLFAEAKNYNKYYGSSYSTAKLHRANKTGI